MRPELRRVIRRTSYVAAGIAAVLSPIPLADEIVLLPVFGYMTVTIGKQNGLSVVRIPWKAVSKSVGLGLAARAGANLAVSMIPVVAAIANAASAIALVEVLGRDVDKACAEVSGGMRVEEVVGTAANGVAHA